MRSSCFEPRHCERSEAIQSESRDALDCRVACGSSQ